MGLGFAKSFVIILILAVAFSIWTKNALNGLVLVLIYAVVRIVWKLLTQKHQRL